MDLSEMCKTVREDYKLSQSRLAELIGSTQTEISFIEKGFIPRDERKIDRLCELYVKGIK